MSIFGGEKIRENVAVLHFFTVDNFDFTRKLFRPKKIVKMFQFCTFLAFDNFDFTRKFDFSNSVIVVYVLMRLISLLNKMIQFKMTFSKGRNWRFFSLSGWRWSSQPSSKSSRSWITFYLRLRKDPVCSVIMQFPVRNNFNFFLKREIIGVSNIEFVKLEFWHIHSVWKSQKKSHSTLRAKRATFTFWVDKS